MGINNQSQTFRKTRNDGCNRGTFPRAQALQFSEVKYSFRQGLRQPRILAFIGNTVSFVSKCAGINLRDGKGQELEHHNMQVIHAVPERFSRSMLQPPWRNALTRSLPPIKKSGQNNGSTRSDQQLEPDRMGDTFSSFLP